MGTQNHTRILLLIIGLITIASSNYIRDDITPGFGEVKKLLAAYRKRIVEKYGFEYESVNMTNVAETIEKEGSFPKSITEINRKIWNEVFEGDILLTLDQAKEILVESSAYQLFDTVITGISDNTRKKRSYRNNTRFWSLPISYKFGNTNQAWRQSIRRSIRHIEENTCVRFKENGGNSDGLLFVKEGGCASWVGRIGGIQEIYIDNGCELIGTVSHEILHALGLEHEQNRYDRNSYVFVDYNNIIQSKYDQYEKLTTSNSYNLGLPYEYGSVMHYQANEFASNSERYAMVPKDPMYLRTMGQRDGISFKDAKMINLKYCDNICQQNLNCLNGGYPDPNNCNQCRCPSGYGGRFCGDIEPSPRFCCNQPTTITSEKNEVTLIYFGGPASYPPRAEFTLRYRSVSRAQKTIAIVPFANETDTMAQASASWSDWGEWSACSQPCGGCGTRTRVRSCYGGNQICSGSNLERQSCNTQVCVEPKKEMICNGRTLLPCDSLTKLKFESENLNPRFRPALNQQLKTVLSIGKILSSSVRRVKRQTATRLCEKRYTYECPTAILNEEVEYKEQKFKTDDTSSEQFPECCSGYTPNQGVCLKN